MAARIGLYRLAVKGRPIDINIAQISAIEHSDGSARVVMACGTSYEITNREAVERLYTIIEGEDENE